MLHAAVIPPCPVLTVVMTIVRGDRPAWMETVLMTTSRETGILYQVSPRLSVPLAGSQVMHPGFLLYLMAATERI